MKTCMVTFLLVLFEANLSFGHRLPNIEKPSQKKLKLSGCIESWNMVQYKCAMTALKNETEIYEVKEDQSALLITHPKDEATKLREIIYYHVIERPYDSKDLSHDKIETDFERRFFTNSHSGIQFEKKDCDDDDDGDKSSSEELDDDSSNSSEETDYDSNSSESNEENENEQSSDKNDLSKDKINGHDKSSSNKYGDNDLIKNDTSDVDSPIDVDSMQIDIRFSDFVVNTTEGDVKVKNATTNVTAGPETKTEGKLETPQSRRKREINHTVTGKSNSVKAGDEFNQADGQTPKKEGRTYGMSLTGNRGVVWNDVKPTHTEYYVGETEDLTTSMSEVVAEDITTTESAKETEVLPEVDEDNQGDDDGDDDDEKEFIETIAEIGKLLDKIIDNMDKTNKSESKQDGSENSMGENKHEDDNEHDNEDSNLDPIEIEKSFIEIFKVFKELTGDYTNNLSGTDVNNTTKSDADISEEKVAGESSNGNFLRANNEDEEVSNDTPVKLGAKLAPKINEKDKEPSNKEKDSKQQQFVKELLKNKYFWAWLKDASGAYLEILMKKLDAVIKFEIGKQIEQYIKEHKNENCKQDKIDQNNAAQEPVQISNVTDENVKGNTSDTQSSTDHNGLASNDTTAESINESNKTNSAIATKKHKEKPSDDKNADKSVKIEAQNLFGSSVGSGEVTNIFIYNINKEFDLEHFKPIKNGTNGVFVFGLDDKKPDQEKQDASDKDTIPEFETVKPDISSEHNKTVDKVVVTSENQTSTAKPETKKDHQSYEKDKIEDKEHVKDEDSVTDKSEVIPNDKTSTKANNEDKTSTEISKEESASITENPLEGKKDDKEKDAKTGNVETNKDLNDSENDKSKYTTEVEKTK